MSNKNIRKMGIRLTCGKCGKEYRDRGQGCRWCEMVAFNRQYIRGPTA